jgi:hypothetical protein
MATYYSPHWGTRDGVIPHKLFFLLLGAWENVQAMEQLSEVQAVAHGAALAVNGKDFKLKAATRKLAALAFPEE